MATQVVYQIEIVGLRNADRSIQGLINRNKALGQALKGVPEAGSAAFKQLDDRIKQASGGTQNLVDLQNQLQKEFAENTLAVKQFNRELRQGEASANSLNGLRNRLIEIRQELGKVRIGSTAFKELTRQSADVAKRLREAEIAAGQFGRNVGNYPTIAASITQSFEQVGRVLLATFSISGIVNAATRAFRSFLDTAEAFSKEIANVRAISNATDEEFQRLSDTAQELGRTTAFSATSAAQGMTELAKAGFSVNEIIAASPAVLNLAVAAQTELANAADITATVLRTYALEAEEAGRVTDIITRTITSSKTDIDTFRESFKVLGPAASALGVSLTEASAAIGLLGDRGLTGTDATTALSTGLARLAAQPGQVAEEMKRLNLQVFDSNGQFIGLANLIAELEQKYAAFTDEQRAASIAALFGARAFRQVNILLDSQKTLQDDVVDATFQGSEALREYTAFIERAGEAQGDFTQRLADTQLDSFSGALVLLRSATEGLELSLLSLVEGPLRAFIGGVREVVTLISDFAQGETTLNRVLEDNANTIKVLATVFGLYTAAIVAGNIARAVRRRFAAIDQALFVAEEAAIKKATIAQQIYTAAKLAFTNQIKITTAVVRIFQATISSFTGVLGLLTIAITAVVFIFDQIAAAERRATEEANRYIDSADNMKASTDAVTQSFTEEKKKLDDLFDPLRKTTEGTDERRRAVQALENAYPGLLAQYDLDKASQEELTEVYKLLNNEILQRTLLTAASEENSKLIQERIKLTDELRIAEEELTTAQERANTIRQASGSDPFGQASRTFQASSAVQGQRDRVQELNEALDINAQNLDSIATKYQEVGKRLIENTKGLDLSISGIKESLKNIEGSAAQGLDQIDKAFQDRVNSFSASIQQISQEQGRAGLNQIQELQRGFLRQLEQSEAFARLSGRRQAELQSQVNSAVEAERKKFRTRATRAEQQEDAKRLQDLRKQADRIIDTNAKLNAELIEQHRIRRLEELTQDSAFFRTSGEQQLALLAQIEAEAADLQDRARTNEQRKRDEARKAEIAAIEADTQTQINLLNQQLGVRLASLENSQEEREEAERQHAQQLIAIRIERNLRLAEIAAQGNEDELARIAELRATFQLRLRQELGLASNELNALEQELNTQLAASFAARRELLQRGLQDELQQLEQLRQARIEAENLRNQTTLDSVNERQGILTPEQFNAAIEAEERRHSEALIAIDLQTTQRRTQINQNFNKGFADLVKERNAEIESEEQEDITAEQQRFNRRLQALTQALANEEITEKEFQQKREQLEREHREKTTGNTN